MTNLRKMGGETMKNKVLQKMMDKIEKEWRKPPKVQLFAQNPKDEQKANMMQQILEYQWEQNWPFVKADLESRMRIMIHKCYFVGSHNWIGFGEKGRHICKNCGLKAGIAYDPNFNSFVRSFWDVK